MIGSDGDERLRAAYAALMEERARTADPPDIPVEEIQALAEGTWRGGDRAARLEEVLADARTAREFHFFLDLAAQKPREQRARVPSWLAAAAALLLMISGVAIWRAVSTGTAAVTRSEDSAVELLAPETGSPLESGALFAWRPVAGASDYQLEVIDEEGNSLIAAATIDTTYLMPASIVPASGMTYRWWVVARLLDGTELRAPANITFGR